MRGSNFSYLVKQGVTSVWHNRMMSFASLCIITVSLLLVGLVVLVGIDLNIVISNIESKNEVLVYTQEVTDEQLVRIEEVIKSNEYTASVVFYSKEEAWEAEKNKPGMQEYSDLFNAMEDNPMPDTFRVTVNDIKMMDEVKTDFEKIEGVESVSAPFDFASVLVSVRNTMSVVALAVFIAMVVVSLVIVYNTSRASVFARRKQISIMKYVGATNAFVKIPFFFEGMFVGILGGIASWALTGVAYNSIMGLFADDITMWQILGLVNVLDFNSITFIVLGINCLAGALLGAIGTVMSMGKHLRV